MQLQVLGIGSGFTLHQFHTNFVLKDGETSILIDAGTTLRQSLHAQQIAMTSIRYVFITHFHHDHVGGLSELLQQNYWHFENGEHKPIILELIIRKEQLKELEMLLAPSLNNQGLTWDSYCNVQFFEDNKYRIGETIFHCLITDNLHCEDMHSYGLKVENNNRNIIISGDIKVLEHSRLRELIDECTVALLQDASFEQNPLHASIEEIERYYVEEQLEKIYGVHYEQEQAETAIHLATQGQIFNL